MSPEGVAHGMQEYTRSLKHQVAVAKAFFFGQVERGMEGLLSLPVDIQLHVDQLIWDATGGKLLDPMEDGELIASALLHSLEIRMGIHDESSESL